ncbi:hypothetical protein Tco_0017835 [Tanacetum coccineum]
MDLNAFIRTADPHCRHSVERAEFELKNASVMMVEIMGLIPLWSDKVEPTVAVTEPVKLNICTNRSKKKRVTRESERMPAASHPPKRLRADYGLTGVPLTGVSLLVSLQLLQEVSNTVEQGPSARFVVLSDSSHHSGAKSADPEVDSLVRSAALVKTELPLFYNCYTIAIPTEGAIGWRTRELVWRKSIFMNGTRPRDLSLMNGGFNVSAARNLSLSSEVRMRAEYNIWRRENGISREEKDSFLVGERQGVLKTWNLNCLKQRRSLRSAQAPQLRVQEPSSIFLKSQTKGLVNQVHELDISSADSLKKNKAGDVRGKSESI